MSTPPCHVQAVTCLAVTPYHVLSASDDSNINVWSLARLLEFDTQAELEPDLVLSNHRGAITGLVVGPSTNPESSICVSASKDKTCIIWNYQTGQVLRTLLFPAVPLCLSLDPSARAVLVASDNGALFLVEFFGEKPILGSSSAELASIVVQANAPLAVSDPDLGPPSCLALTYDGTSVLSGHTKGKILKWSLAENAHPAVLANLNASVTNLCFIPPISETKSAKAVNIVKPNHNQQQYTFMAQLETDLSPRTRFDQMLQAKGFSSQSVESATASFLQSQSDGGADAETERLDQQFRSIINDQKILGWSSQPHISAQQPA